MDNVCISDIMFDEIGVENKNILKNDEDLLVREIVFIKDGIIIVLIYDVVVEDQEILILESKVIFILIVLFRVSDDGSIVEVLNGDLRVVYVVEEIVDF